MFTGIIEGMGVVSGIRPAEAGKRFAVTADFALEGTGIGDSIAVSGACLTVISLNQTRFEADVSPETLARTTFGNIRIGDRVNLERALRLSDRLDGHLVSGHIDGVGTIIDKTSLGNAVIVTVEVDDSLKRYMIEKGSVAVDGISLTINRLEKSSFQVSIIPHTAKLTTIGFKNPGMKVNIETDMIGKYVERFVGRMQRDSDGGKDASGSRLDMSLLVRSGFL